MNKYYALQSDTNDMSFYCIAETFADHQEKVEKFVRQRRGMMPKGGNSTKEYILKNLIPVIVTIEHQTEPKPNEAVTK